MRTAMATQVVLFTHHEHVIEVAQQTVGEGAFRLNRLGPAGTLVAA